MDRQDDQPTTPSPPTNPAPEPGAAQPSAAETQLALALRMLANQTHTAPADLRLLPGQTPDDFPLTLPLPPSARILGSMTHGEPPNGAWVVTVLVDAPLSPEESIAFYVKALEAASWTQEVMPHMRSGFVHVQSGGFTFVNFHSATDDRMLTISTMTEADQRETALAIVARQDYRPREMRGRMPDMMALIPTLLPPPGASQEGGGGGGGAGRWQTNAHVETALPVAELLAHYDQQLEKGGWRRRDGGASGPAGWSFWAFQDDVGQPWRGVFFALSSPDRPREYLVLVQIEAENQRGPQGHGAASGISMASLRAN